MVWIVVYGVVAALLSGELAHSKGFVPHAGSRSPLRPTIDPVEAS